MDYDYQYYDYDHLDAVIFRDEKSYEECDTKVDMSWAEHNDPFFVEDEWCILQKITITNAVKETKTYSYYPYKIFQKGSISEVQKMVEDFNQMVKQEPQKYCITQNGCSIKILSFLWGIIVGQRDITSWERIHLGMIEVKPDGSHLNPLYSDPFSVNIIFPTKDTDWTNFDSVSLPDKWHRLSSKDFTRGLRYNFSNDQVTTSIDY